MKKLSIEQKAKRYDEAKLRMSAAYNSNRCTIGFMNEIFPELKESEDERIRKGIIDFLWKEKIFLQEAHSSVENNPKYRFVMDAIAWLEKQDEKDKFIKKELGCIKVYRENAIKRLEELEKQGKNHCMIQWKGDNLKEVIDFTGKDKNFEKWFKSFEEYEKYVQEHDGIFKLFNADGSHYEVPVGAWIVKTPDGYNVASKAVFKQKSVDTPKFKVEQTTAWSEDDKDLMYNTLSNLTELK